MKRSLVIVAGIAVLGGGLALAGGYAYFFSGLRVVPKALSLPAAGTASPTASPTGSAAASGALTGSWNVAAGSQAGYRVTEVFAGQTSPHQAVARTQEVSGSAAAQDSGGSVQVTTLTVRARLAALASQDTVAGFDVANRDRIVRQSLGVAQFPEATFVAQGIPLPRGLEGGSTVSLSVPGQVTIHGVTRDATVAAQVRLNGASLEAVGSTTFDMTQFGIRKPTQPFVTPESAVTLEFQLVLQRPVGRPAGGSG